MKEESPSIPIENSNYYFRKSFTARLYASLKKDNIHVPKFNGFSLLLHNEVNS